VGTVGQDDGGDVAAAAIQAGLGAWILRDVHDAVAGQHRNLDPRRMLGDDAGNHGRAERARDDRRRGDAVGCHDIGGDIGQVKPALQVFARALEIGLGKNGQAVGETVNADPDVNRFLKAAFVPNFNVQNAHTIYPAADLSEQISTAGKEASGTGNVKFMSNGALTIGTIDGANVEMREEARAETFFLFGRTEQEVQAVKANGYRPADYIDGSEEIDGNEELRAVLDLIAAGTFSHGDTEVFRPLVDNLRYDDPFLVCADYASYVNCQEQVSAVWQDWEAWTKMSILNTARSGKFSSDRAIAEYCDDIWNVWPLTVKI
jgi:hypothetical protein